MLRIAIVGCGKIADQHAAQIVSVPGVTIVAVCDAEELMARQLAERFGVPAFFSRVEDLLREAAPDVVHITTPPQSHYAIAKQCLAGGCHVYVEKPFTVTYQEAEDLIRCAQRAGRKLTAGHDAQFTSAANRMRSLVREGYLGGPPIHMESYYCYDFGDPVYARAMLADSSHWVRRLRGGLLQNTISHGIARIAEYLTADEPRVIAYGYTSDFLKALGERELIDELRVIVHDGAATAYFTFSSQMRPSLHMLRLYGPTNGLILDERQQTVIRLRGKAYKSYLEQFLPEWSFAKQYAANSLGNMKKFAKADFHGEYGKQHLIREFYRSITEDTPLPLSLAEIQRTAWIMEEIFSQLQERAAAEAERLALSSAVPAVV